MAYERQNTSGHNLSLIHILNYYCAGGRILGAVKMAGVWLLPKTAEKPMDACTKAVSYTHLDVYKRQVLLLLVCYILSAVSSIFPTLGSGLALSLIHISNWG